MNWPPYICRYRLPLRTGPANARSRRREVEGFLIRHDEGYGCVNPWPELGDPAVDELLTILREGRAHRLLARALACAGADGAARRAGRSLFERPIPRSHATVTGDADFGALATAGFTTVKLKTHSADATLLPRVRAAVEAGLRIRLDCNGTGIDALRDVRPWAEMIEFVEDPEPYHSTRWQEIRAALGLHLALDRHTGAVAGGYEVRVLKPAFDSTRPQKTPVVFTSYMDHPLGQMFAAWEASQYAGPQLEAGLLTHHLFEPDAFTEAIRASGPQLMPAGGTGLGFDTLLESLPWEKLEAAPGKLLQNPRAPVASPPPELPAAHFIFPTSGSTDKPSLVCLTPAALMANAAAVNDWLDATSDDVWLRVLPEFHVGGIGIRYRAELAGSRVVADEEKWNAARFTALIAEKGVTLTSLVPAQVYDLVAASQPSPPSLRAIIVGGGKLEASLYMQSRALGWPVLPSYGMTEAASQIATAIPGGDDSMQLLPCWEARADGEGRLQIRGAALFSGRMVPEQEHWTFQAGLDGDGWFTTSDRVQMEGRILTPVGRCDRVVKILGELVDLDAIETTLLAVGMPPDRGVVVAFPDARAGVRPWLVTDCENAGTYVAAANASLPPFAAIAGIKKRELPRSPLGKVLRREVDF